MQQLFRGGWIRRHPKAFALAVAAAAAIAIGVPVAWATFTDVPPSNPFYDDINAIQGAGITQGCGGGNFCPLDNITRQAEAAFVHRAAARIAMSRTLTRTTMVNTDGNQDIGSVTITVPGVGGTQFVRVMGSVTANVSNASCPCNVGYELANAPNTTFGVGGREFDQLPVSGANQRNFRSETVFSATSGTHTYYMSISTSSTVAVTLSNLHLVAQTVTFGSSGGNTLSTAAASAAHHGSDPNRP